MLKRRSFVSLLAGLPIIGGAFMVKAKTEQTSQKLGRSSAQYHAKGKVERRTPVYCGADGMLTLNGTAANHVGWLDRSAPGEDVQWSTLTIEL